MAKTTERAFRDFPTLTGKYKRIQGDLRDLYRNLEELETLRSDIMDDAERSAELKKIIDIHPELTVTKIKNEISKLMALKEHLEKEFTF